MYRSYLLSNLLTSPKSVLFHSVLGDLRSTCVRATSSRAIGTKQPSDPGDSGGLRLGNDSHRCLPAAQIAAAQNFVIVTATTNMACAQFTDTLFRFDDYRQLSVLRFIADSALIDGRRWIYLQSYSHSSNDTGREWKPRRHTVTKYMAKDLGYWRH